MFPKPSVAAINGSCADAVLTEAHRTFVNSKFFSGTPAAIKLVKDQPNYALSLFVRVEAESASRIFARNTRRAWVLRPRDQRWRVLRSSFDSLIVLARFMISRRWGRRRAAGVHSQVPRIARIIG